MCTRLTKQKKAWLIILIVVGLMVGCGEQKSSLSERGQEALVDHIGKLSNSSVEYEIISSEEAPDYSAAEQQISYSNSDDFISGCPDDVGGRDMWCVVLDREINSTRGKAYSHFLVQRLSGNWYVEELDASEQDEFAHLGCQNWEDSVISDN